MTETPAKKELKLEEIIKEAAAIPCPVGRLEKVVKGFLGGPMCGRCFPCSFGSYEALLRLGNLTTDTGSADDIETMRKIAAQMTEMSMCKKGKDMAAYISSLIDDPAFGEHCSGLCKAGHCITFIEYRNVQERCIRCGKCQEVCPSGAIIGEKQVSHRCCFLPFEIRQRRCTKCGECIKVCPTNAIVVVNIEQDAASTAKTGGK